MRGIAALIVIAWHLLLAFDPRRPGVMPDFPPAQSWIGTPWYGLVNGTASVGFFFVLSGYVLTYRSLARNDAGVLARGAIKRWPRLAGTVALASIISWSIFPLGWHWFAEAARLTKSPWLANFGFLPPISHPVANWQDAYQARTMVYSLPRRGLACPFARHSCTGWAGRLSCARSNCVQVGRDG